MKKSQIASIILIIVISMCNAIYFIYSGYANGSDKIVLGTVEGIVEEYRVHNGAAFVTLEGHEIVYRASTNGDYENLGLQERPLIVGEKVKLLIETKTRGDRYPIVGIATETWTVSIEDTYLKGWDRFQLLTSLFGAFLGLAGIATSIFLIIRFKKINQKSAVGDLTNNEPEMMNLSFITPTSIIREPSPKGRVLMNQTYNGLDIDVKRVFGATELIVDGMVYAEEKGVVETSYALEAYVKNIPIRFEQRGSIMFFRCRW